MIQSSCRQRHLEAARSHLGPLHGRAGTVRRSQVNEDVATDDEEADLEWAKEILTAIGGRR